MHVRDFDRNFSRGLDQPQVVFVDPKLSWISEFPVRLNITSGIVEIPYNFR
jgi:hypothetical protein